jgi:hypothetical protein
MSGIILLNSILEKNKSKYPAGLSVDDLFEFYCADTLLVNYDLDNSEIEEGIVDGSKDAGIDAAYVFVNRQLLVEDFDFDSIKQKPEIELYIIQSKNQESFKEGPVDALSASLPLLLDPERDPNRLAQLFKPQVVAIFQAFLNAMKALAGEFPKVYIRIFYCSKGGVPNSVIEEKAAGLAKNLRDKYQNVEFSLVGAQQLYDKSSSQKRLTKELPTVGTPLSGTNSYVALCHLRDYGKFIADEEARLINRIFEANVRAYQGDVEVNQEIAQSLKEPPEGVDFWWMNNGVTIVADQAQFMNNRLMIENPLIVNGLQTTHELHKHASLIGETDQRMVLVRVIVENNRENRDQIIRATNRQTNIKHSSFRATEAVHRELEDYLGTLGLFYDRRKNFYKREGKPADKIISIDRLAQATLAVLLQEPHTARARPTGALKGDDNYRRLFSGDKSKHPLETYGFIVRMLMAVEKHFRAIACEDNQAHRNNLKFHVLMVLSWAINKSKNLPALRIAQLNTVGEFDNALIAAVTNWVFKQFDISGPNDKTAKDRDFTVKLQEIWTAPSS